MAFEILTVDQLISRLSGRKYKYSQVHHTWEPSHSDFNGKNHIALQNAMRNYHVNSRGWDDIGQHVTLMPDGLFVTGRPFNETPAGIVGYNTGAFMTEMLGNFDIGKDKLEGAQLASMLKLQYFLTTKCGAEIMFHREHAAKTCPGTGIDKSVFLRQVANYGTNHPIAQPVAFQPERQSTSTQPNLLKLGDKGSDVKTLQEYLMKAGEKLPRYGADGDFGEETLQAVKSFQASHGLSVDGIVGPETKAKLEEVIKTPAPSYPGHLIKEGSSDKKNVKLIQAKLGITADGIFGPRTEAAVKAWQKAHGLSADGIVGPKTWEKLF
ncbi:N-acetylmuramoyl-L-alanine amidase [Neobacillus pocheonensis]|uniref:peptidoglycan recognition protein family protein n=1 Tax=Neobacillus pocheonensis TaxID=363869 RepID=UPI003D2CD787